MKTLKVSLAVKAAAELELRRRRRDSESSNPPLWEPDEFNIPQQQAFASQADITGFGGSAGSGKSDTLIGIACRQHKRSTIFRRESVQLDGLVDRSRELFEGKGRFNGKDLVWRDLPGDKILKFAHAQHSGDEFKQQGKPKDFIGFDELPHFLESQFWNILGWLRSEDPEQRKRVVATFNPPTNAQERWVITLFADWLDRSHPNPAMPGELRWRARINGKLVDRPNGDPFVHTDDNGRSETITPLSWTFFPARLSDNRYYANSGYGAQLQQLPEPLRSQLLYGDFDAAIEDDAWQIIPTKWIQAAMARWKAAGGEKYSTVGFSPDVVSEDVAQGGPDKTVVGRKYSHWVAPLDYHKGLDTPDGMSAAKVVMLRHSGKARVHVDCTGGWGSSSFERLRDDYELGDLVIPIDFGGKSTYRDKSGLYRMYNKRAEMYWRVRDALDPNQPGGSQVMLPDDPDLLADLAAARYEVRGETFKVEEKYEIAKRIGRSPDAGDAVVMLFIPSEVVSKEDDRLHSGKNPTAGYRGTRAKRGR